MLSGFDMSGLLNSVITPGAGLTVIRQIEGRLAKNTLPLVNHSALSGPTAISVGAVIPGSVKFVNVPVAVIRPIEGLDWGGLPLANHSAPSGPAVIPLVPLYPPEI